LREYVGDALGACRVALGRSVHDHRLVTHGKDLQILAAVVALTYRNDPSVSRLRTGEPPISACNDYGRSRGRYYFYVRETLILCPRDTDWPGKRLCAGRQDVLAGLVSAEQSHDADGVALARDGRDGSAETEKLRGGGFT
jgi:hypothetical protein